MCVSCVSGVKLQNQVEEKQSCSGEKRLEIKKISLENVKIRKLPLKARNLKIQSSHIREDENFLFFVHQDNIQEISLIDSCIDTFYKLGVGRLNSYQDLSLREAVIID